MWALYRTLESMGVDGISDIALEDGVEAIAEIEILKYRGEEIPPKAQELYDKAMNGELYKELYDKTMKGESDNDNDIIKG